MLNTSWLLELSLSINVFFIHFKSLCISIISLIKIIIKKSVVRKIFISRVLSAPNFYCCNFYGRAVPWASPFEFVSMQI